MNRTTRTKKDRSEMNKDQRLAMQRAALNAVDPDIAPLVEKGEVKRKPYSGDTLMCFVWRELQDAEDYQQAEDMMETAIKELTAVKEAIRGCALNANADTMRDAVSLLGTLGATWEHPGCIYVPLRPFQFTLVVGDANGPFGYSIAGDDGWYNIDFTDPEQELPTTASPKELADWITRKHTVIVHALTEANTAEDVDELDERSDIETAKARCPADFSDSERAVVHSILLTLLHRALGRA